MTDLAKLFIILAVVVAVGCAVYFATKGSYTDPYIVHQDEFEVVHIYVQDQVLFPIYRSPIPGDTLGNTHLDSIRLAGLNQKFYMIHFGMSGQ